jgi:uncharacterized protein
MLRKYLNFKQISFFVTEACNLNCTYCYNAYHSPKFMSEEIALANLRLYMNVLTGKQERVWVTFTGGEPLLNYNLITKMIDEAKRLGKKNSKKVMFNLTTNGTLLDNKILDRLHKEELFLALSIDGKKEHHDKYRITINGKGTHDKVIKNLKNALKVFGKERVRARMTIQPSKAQYLKENIDYLVSQGLNNIHFAPNYEIEWNQSEVNNYFQQIRLLHKKINTVYSKIKLEPIKTYLNHDFKFEEKWGPYEHQCGLLLTVSPEGNFFPCPRFVSLNKYNLGDSHNPSKIILGLLKWNTDLKKAHENKSFHFFCPANNTKINCTISKLIPVFSEFKDKMQKITKE